MNKEQHSLLRQSFVHLKGVGVRKEKRLWQAGIFDWSDLELIAATLFRGQRLDDLKKSLDRSQEAWEMGDLHYFQKTLPSQERWRLIPGNHEQIAYLDIEASGGGLPPLAHSTTIGFYFRGELLQAYEPGDKVRLLEKILEEAHLLCTFSGATYDIPFLAKEWARPIQTAHIDLCPWLRSMGFRGGLKAIQKSLPHIHQRSSSDLDGYDAVRLWQLHLEGWEGALETLLTYNAEDILILQPLLQEAYLREAQRRPELALPSLETPALPDLKTKVDPDVYRHLRTSHLKL